MELACAEGGVMVGLSDVCSLVVALKTAIPAETMQRCAKELASVSVWPSPVQAAVLVSCSVLVSYCSAKAGNLIELHGPDDPVEGDPLSVCQRDLCKHFDILSTLFGSRMWQTVCQRARPSEVGC